jgi:hypothetical protein
MEEAALHAPNVVQIHKYQQLALINQIPNVHAA